MPASDRDDGDRRALPRAPKPPPGRARLAAAALALAAVLALAWWLGARDGARHAPPATAAPADALGAVAPAATARPATAAAGSDVATLRRRVAASSLRDAAADGDYPRDRDGRLRADAALVRRFEWWLSLTGEFAADEIRALVFADAADAHGEAFAWDVDARFAAYVGMREELAAGDLAPDLATRLQVLRAAHRRWFGADAEAMFGAEEAALASTVARRALLLDPALTDAERAQALAALDATRPAAERRAELDATAAQVADEQERDFADRGLDAAGRHRERAALWGDAAADRLAALDRDRAAWDARVAAYRRDRARILASPALDAAARDRALAALLLPFSAAERLRLGAGPGP